MLRIESLCEDLNQVCIEKIKYNKTISKNRNSWHFNSLYNDKDNERIEAAINYILNHYDENIPLEKIAGIANYSKAAFCRFFKQRTRKTFSTFLNEVRISKACKDLRNSDLNISEICYRNGFNNISNFNRQFKSYMGRTPKSYAEKCRQISTLHTYDDG